MLATLIKPDAGSARVLGHDIVADAPAVRRRVSLTGRLPHHRGPGRGAGFRPAGGVIGVVLSIVLLLVFCFALSWVWTVFGLLLRTPTAVQGWSMMLQFPLTFISNIFVDPRTMPSWLQKFVAVNPVSALVDAVRGLMAGRVDGGQITTVLIMSVVLTAVFGPLTMRLYRTRN
jgi:ABC-2 type transport system permease protein